MRLKLLHQERNREINAEIWCLYNPYHKLCHRAVQRNPAASPTLFKELVISGSLGEPYFVTMKLGTGCRADSLESTIAGVCHKIRILYLNFNIMQCLNCILMLSVLVLVQL